MTFPAVPLEAVIVRASVTVWLKVPAFAVIVTVDDPAGAEGDTTNARVPTVAEFAVNDGITLAGKPETLSRIGLLKPFCGVKVKVTFAEPPAAILRADGERAKVKEGGLVMLSATEVLALNVPDVPVMIAVTFPAAAVLLAVKVTLLVPVAVAGLKLAVTPEGRPEAASFTDALNPFCA